MLKTIYKDTQRAKSATIQEDFKSTIKSGTIKVDLKSTTTETIFKSASVNYIDGRMQEVTNLLDGHALKIEM